MKKTLWTSVINGPMSPPSLRISWIPAKSKSRLLAIASLLSRKCWTEQKFAKASSFKISWINSLVDGDAL